MLQLCFGRAHRHVPAHAAHRVCGLLFALIFCTQALAEPQAPVGPEREKETHGPPPTNANEQAESRPERRTPIPKDEGLLLRRDPTFSYGIVAGLVQSFISVDFSQETFTGFGFSGGGNIGLYLQRDLVLRGYGLYTSHSGSDSVGTQLSFGLFDLGASLDYTVDRVLFQVGLQYSMGINTGSLPRASQIVSSSDLSSFWGVTGIGYEIPVAHYLAIVPTLRYGLSFNSLPAGFQAVSFLLQLNFRG